MASIDGESLELEVKHKDNGSWHPCRVSLSSSDSKYGIVIDFENSNEEDIIFSKEDALARLRFRSTPLQDGECSHIKGGDSVLAVYKDQFRSMFFDAVIEKPNRVKHSNRVFCRCTFEIKWLNAELKEETMTVPSKSIMKLSREEIDRDPIFAAFLNALSPTDGVETSSPLSFLEETNYDYNLQGILDEQIEQISKLADESIEFSADLLEFKRANFGGYKQNKAAAALRVSSNNHQNNFRRSTRSQNKEQTEVKLKKNLEEDKPFLSPLAARAALASLVHERELPLQRELSISHAEKQNKESLVQRDSKNYIEVDSLGMAYEYTKCGSSSLDNIPNLSNPFQNGDDDTRVDSRGISRHSNKTGPPKNTKPKESPYLEKPLRTTEGTEGVKGSTISIVNKLIGSTKVGKLNGRSMTSRVTRSSVHKEIEVSPDEVKEGFPGEKLTTPVNTTRKTRSSAHKETEVSPDEMKEGSPGEKLTTPVNTTRKTRSSAHKETEVSPDEMKEGFPGEKLTAPVNTTRKTRSSAHKETEVSPDEMKEGSPGEKLTTPVNTGKTCSSMLKETESLLDDAKQGSSNQKLASPVISARVTRSRNYKEQRNVKDDQEPKNSDVIQDTHGTSEETEDEKESSPTVDSMTVRKLSGQPMKTRVTRSAVHKEIEASSEETKQGFSSKKNESKNKRSISSTDLNKELPYERNKRTRASHVATITAEDSGTVLEDSEDSSVEKKRAERNKTILSNKPQLRSSPRLQFPPRTCSQKNASTAC